MCLAPPGPPSPKVTDWTKSTVDLEWIPPLNDGGSKVTGYFVEYKEEGEKKKEVVAEVEEGEEKEEEWEKVTICSCLPSLESNSGICL